MTHAVKIYKTTRWAFRAATKVQNATGIYTSVCRVAGGRIVVMQGDAYLRNNGYIR